MLRGVLMEGRREEEPKKVKEMIKNFFRERFKEEEWCRPTLEGVHFQIFLKTNMVILRRMR